jgi:hypothetical protein
MECRCLARRGCLVLRGSHFGNTSDKASLILRLSFGYASLVPGWDEAKSEEITIVVAHM